MLCELGYEYVNIHNETDLISNLRNQLEMLSDYKFSNNEWKMFFNSYIVNNKVY